jgi:hypothetical protein
MVFCIVLNIGLSAYFINGSFKKFFFTNNIKLKTLVQRNKPLGLEFVYTSLYYEITH